MAKRSLARLEVDTDVSTLPYHKPKTLTKLRIKLPRRALSLHAIFTGENLYRTGRNIQLFGGRAAGPDGIMPRQVSTHELGLLARKLADHIKKDKYRHGPTRAIMIPKGPGRGDRQIDVPNFPDRIVSRLLHDALAPIWGKRFLPDSVGFRPGLGCWMALAKVIHAVREGFTVISKVDIRDAFGHVSAQSVLEAHRRLKTAVWRDKRERERILAVMATVLNGGQQERERGVDQGSSFSPLALNILLHEIHDRQIDHMLSKAQSGKWVRYADDIVYLTRTVASGKKTVEYAESQIAERGMHFKPSKNPTVNLRARTIEFLGMTIRVIDGKTVQFEVPKSAVSYLKQRLTEARCGPNPGRAAQKLLEGWVGYFAPVAYTDVIKSAFQAAREYGFVEVDESELERVQLAGQSKWLNVLEGNSRIKTDSAGLGQQPWPETAFDENAQSKPTRLSSEVSRPRV